MSASIQSAKNLLWAVVRRQRQTLTTCRHAHSTASTIPLISSRARPVNLGQVPLIPYLRPSGTGDLHARKRRKYSQDAPAPPNRKINPRFQEDEWEAVESSTLLVRPRKASARSKHGSIAARPSKDGNSRPFKNKKAFNSVTPNSTKDADGGRLVAKENRALFLPREPEAWQVQKKALVQKFKDEGWRPRKKLSPDTLDGIRALHEQDPEKYSTPTLAEHFKVSPESIRRILKSNFRPSEAQMQDRRARWAKRHDKIWDQKVELGLRPKRTKDRPLEDPEEFEENLKAKEMLDAARSS